MPDILSSVARRYWHEEEWLGLPISVGSPTYYHLLRAAPDDLDEDAVTRHADALARRFRQRSKDTSDPLAQRVAETLLGIVLTARRTLTDQELREAYLGQLRSEFATRAESLLNHWGVRSADGLTPTMREQLIAEARGLCLPRETAEAEIARVVERVLEPMPFEGDPGRPTYFDAIDLPETACPEDRHLIERSRDRILWDLAARERRTHLAGRKRELQTQALEVRLAAEVLCDPARREQYVAELRQWRLAAFRRAVAIEVAGAGRSLTVGQYDRLMAQAAHLRLDPKDAKAAMEDRGIRMPSGKLAPWLAIVGLAVVYSMLMAAGTITRSGALIDATAWAGMALAGVLLLVSRSWRYALLAAGMWLLYACL